MGVALVDSLWDIPAITLVVGLVLVLLALRGRRIDDQPLCRKCSYDLTGSMESAFCPECGADLKHPKAVVRGHRQRRGAMLAWGIGLTLPSLVVLAGLFYVTINGMNPDRLKPVRWLVRQGDVAALTELSRRHAAGELSAAQTGCVIDHALALQADRNRPWNPAWGDFVENAFRAGTVSEAQWKTYVQQAFEVKLEVRPRVRRGGHVVLRVTPALDRAATPTIIDWAGYDSEVTLDGATLPSLGPSGYIDTPFPNFFGPPIDLTRQFVTERWIDQVPDGPRPLVVDVNMRADVSRQSAERVEFTVRRQDTVAIVPAEQSDVELRSDPVTRTAVESALKRHLTIGVGFDRTVTIQLAVTRPPVGVSLDVALRNRDGREWAIGTAEFPAGAVKGWSAARKLDGFEVDRVDVILHGNRSMKITDGSLSAELWDGDVILRDFPVAWPPGLEMKAARAEAAPR